MARAPEDAVVGSRTHVHALHGVAQFLQACSVELGVFVQQAWIHRRHEHERRGVLCRIFCPTDTDNPVLQRLAHHLQHTAIELGQLIQAEEMVPLFAILWH